MKTVKDIALACGCDHKTVILAINRGIAPDCTQLRVGMRKYRLWDEEDAEATIAAIKAHGSFTQKLTTEEERELVAKCAQLRDEGCSWRRIWETISTPYTDSNTLIYLCKKHGYADGRRSDPEALNAKRTEISMAWANNPPPGSETWSDAEWLRRIDQAAFGRRAQEEDTDD